MNNLENQQHSNDAKASRQQWFAWLQQLWQLMGIGWSRKILQPMQWEFRKWIRLVVILALVAFVIACIRHGTVYVRENQVGVLVNNLNGKLHLKDRIGYHFFFPYLCDFYLFEKSIQILDYIWTPQAGGSPRDIKLKTRDGSDVSMDITLNYKLIPEKAITVLTKTGQKMQHLETWLESYARHISLEIFGELTSEEMYNAEQRNAKAQECRVNINEQLNPLGIEVIAFIPGEIRFYKEYEMVIQEKKLADQEVEEQQAQARAALQLQQRRVLEERTKSNVEIRKVEGEIKNKLTQARAEAEKIRIEAEQSFFTTQRLADASLYSASATAEGLRMNKIAEAEGMEKIREALSGDGGIGIVGLEYARRLSETHFTGTPITRDPNIQQFSVQQDAAAVMNRGSQTVNRNLSGGQP